MAAVMTLVTPRRTVVVLTLRGRVVALTTALGVRRRRVGTTTETTLLTVVTTVTVTLTIPLITHTTNYYTTLI
jgi:hypothetical protein